MKKRRLSKRELMKEYITADMSRNKAADIKSIKKFVDSLDKKQINYMCKFLSLWQQNGVADFIDMYDKWEIEKIPISKLKMRHINKKTDALLKKDKFELYKIAKDGKVVKNPEFRTQGKIKDEKIIVARIGNEYKIIDGDHRSVEVIKLGNKKIEAIKPIEGKRHKIKNFLRRIFYKIV